MSYKGPATTWLHSITGGETGLKPVAWNDSKPAVEFPEDTATVFDPRGFPHVGHLTDQRDEANGTALYSFPGDFIAGDGTEAWLNPFTAGDAETLADYLSCDDETWTA